MGLKQDIVIVNEYTKKTSSGGTRGSSPGSYVLNYMARPGASETMAPVLVSPIDTYITKYMLREEAVETWQNDLQKAKEEIAKTEGYAGKAFGSVGQDQGPELSFSHHRVKEVAKKIQDLYEDGHTVLKTVISFSDDYAYRMGLLRHSFKHRKKGDWGGNIDEARLRSAITAGVVELAKDYDDLVWIGCVQVDASKIHCHLCMSDAGRGTVMDDGYQKGTLSKTEMMRLRRSLEDDFKRTKSMSHFSDDLSRDRDDVKAFIKQSAHRAMALNSIPQFLIACLPSDKSLWDATNTSQEMKKANAVTKLYVRSVLETPGSGYPEVLSEIYTHAREQAEELNLSPDQERKLVVNSENRLINECINSVYGVFQELPDEDLKIETPILDVMSCDFEELVQSRTQDPILEFGLKLRSYSSRLSHHKAERRKYAALAKSWEEAKEDDAVSDDSTALYEFYKLEEEYNAKLVVKYIHFLSFFPEEEDEEEILDEIKELRRQLAIYEGISSDEEYADLSEDDRNTYLQEVYNIPPNSPLIKDPNLLSDEIEDIKVEIDDLKEELRQNLQDQGLALEEARDGSLTISSNKIYSFNEVKALDLHHLDYDFVTDIHISKPNIEAFLEITEERGSKLDAAVAYLEGSGQTEFIDDLPLRDVALMRARAQALLDDGTLLAYDEKARGIGKAHPTVSLDNELNSELIDAIKESVESTRDKGFADEDFSF